MAKYVFVMMTNPVSGREDEYNDWYDNQHLGDVLAVDGFEAAQRFRLVGDELSTQGHRYMALYEIESENVNETISRMMALGGSDAMPISGALDGAGSTGRVYESIGERQSS